MYLNRALFLFILSFFLFVFKPAIAQQDTLQVSDWLILGPAETQLPLYHDQQNIQNSTFTISDLLDFEPIDVTHWQPEEGNTVYWSQNKEFEWKSHQTETLEFDINGENPHNYWSSFYLSADQFSEATLILKSHHPFKLFVNGSEKASKTTSEKKDADTGSHSEKLTLTQGKHQILVRSLYDPENNSDFTLSASITSEVPLSVSLTPKHPLDLETLSNRPSVSNLGISADGALAAIQIHKPAPPDGTGDSWLEILETETGDLYREFKGVENFGSLEWAPGGLTFTYTETDEGKTTLWLSDLESGSQQKILDEVENFGSYEWSPDGTFIIYSVSEQAESDDSGVELLGDMEARRPGFDTRNFLFKLNVPEGTSQRLTAGNLTTSLLDISPDGSKLLYSRNHIDYSQRPYNITEYQLLDLETLETDSLFSAGFGGSGQFSPDGESILFIGGPSMFGDIGINIPEETIPNDYDNQAFLYDINSADVNPITREFTPSIDSAIWGENDNTIYFLTTDRSFNTLYKYNLRRSQFTKLSTKPDVVSDVDISSDERIAVYSGTGVSQPVQVFTHDLDQDQSTLLRYPGEEHFSNVEFGNHETWTFTNERGAEIDGVIYYPPNFDPDQKYPVISYYYGGTVPVNRAFGGRYPKELYAAMGYVVYVMQPSGAIGYGQEFSALHVNDWGKIVAGEIIYGVNEFLNEHDFADRVNVGAIGASYGGFMTMLLMTETDLFAAAISHAGISNLSSYWGVGYWGFQYNAVAAANSFPWNREDIYVDQSPLYSADQVTTPLLFVTGAVDTNVPPGESYQMYTALKLLGKETALVEVAGQDHHILDYNKYKLWKSSIISWFDKYLKDQPEWWNHKYSE
ncbi:S9 family peptidase [Rhodohalobacter sulfatireducens]|uniref:Prolyl oligopeptidase family serine peptidase n=1 Tax=Rhodohalobacter sulfatireducens TaxID=2911366 RepID=A0ABS9KFT0_9BACT|nr:prolyl oligopeptidase family serine peptidase [Rhodohalobacter sulfatireducens]MCG2589665.1 prolyl oligopeptidase family serine peptidase [Rhodohalobacter sulfatireducens]